MLLVTGCGSNVWLQKDTGTPENHDISKLKTAILNDIASIIAADTELDRETRLNITQQAISPLQSTSEVQIAGEDAVTRPVAVTFQRAFEQSILNMLDQHRVTRATVVIHTRKPATPLCNPSGEVLPETMLPEMHCDSRQYKPFGIEPLPFGRWLPGASLWSCILPTRKQPEATISH